LQNAVTRRSITHTWRWMMHNYLPDTNWGFAGAKPQSGQHYVPQCETRSKRKKVRFALYSFSKKEKV
jgi:hypothetical protein